MVFNAQNYNAKLNITNFLLDICFKRGGFY